MCVGGGEAINFRSSIAAAQWRRVLATIALNLTVPVDIPLSAISTRVAATFNVFLGRVEEGGRERGSFDRAP